MEREYKGESISIREIIEGENGMGEIYFIRLKGN